MTEKKIVEEAHDAVFDNIMRLVGDEGKFQRGFNYIFNIGLVLVASMTYMNIFMVLSEPEHWCNVPGRELTNFSTEKWRDITLPRDTDSRGIVKFSPCKMYNITVDDIINVSSTISGINETDWNLTFNYTELSITNCHYGYEYNRTWYHETPISKENWVCERELYATNTFVLNRIGEVVGTFVFGQLGDTLGRKLIFYISLITVVGGRLLTIVTTSNFTLFGIVAIIGCLTSNAIFQAPLIIAMETSKSDDRAHIAMLQSIGWTVGVSIMPLMFWWTKEWISFLLLTTLPCCIFLFFPKFMIESPRWLANKGRLKQCAEELNKIAKINGKSIKMTEKKLKEMLPKQDIETVYGMMSLFSAWRIAKNTIIIVICWVAATMAYSVIILNNSKMEGNPFLNFFWQSVVELPAYICGKILGDKIGRRYTNVFSFSLAGIASLMNIFIILDPSLVHWSLILIIIIKFFTSITFYVVNLQSMETYPTCLRQTGISVGGIVANALGVLGPYIVYLGTAYDARYPHLIIGLCLIFGGISALFLPETLHQKLPETLGEAKIFGANQKFWSMPKPIINDVDNEAMEKLNQTQFAI